MRLELLAAKSSCSSVTSESVPFKVFQQRLKILEQITWKTFHQQQQFSSFSFLSFFPSPSSLQFRRRGSILQSLDLSSPRWLLSPDPFVPSWVVEFLCTVPKLIYTSMYAQTCTDWIQSLNSAWNDLLSAWNRSAFLLWTCSQVCPNHSAVISGTFCCWVSKAFCTQLLF